MRQLKQFELGSLGILICASLITGCDSHATHQPTVENEQQTTSDEGLPSDSTQGPGDQGQGGNMSDGARGEGVDFDWRTIARMTEVSVIGFTGDNYGSAFFQEILSRAQPKLFDEPATTAHETLHIVHSDMRQKTSAKDGFFYHRDGKGIYILDPKDNLADVKNHIGSSYQKMAQFNYDTYLVKQLQYWKNTHYLMDEWTCFLATARTAIEVQMAGKWTEKFAGNNVDPLEGLVDLMYFNAASLVSIKKVDPDYLKSNQQYKAAFAMNMEESIAWIKKAATVSYWDKSEAFAKLANLQKADDGAAIRAAIKELLGEAWAKRVLGI